MKKSDICQPPSYFDKYLNFVEDIEILAAFDESLDELDELELSQLIELGDAVYAPDKWTIKDIFQHLIDTEHILAYRALRIGRNDRTKLQGFDQDVLAVNVSTKNKGLDRIVSELILLRMVNKCCLNHLVMKPYNESAFRAGCKCHLWRSVSRSSDIKNIT